MKYIKVISLIVLTVFLFSCDKEEQKNEKSIVVEKMVQQQDGSQATRNWFDDGAQPGVNGVNFGCESPGTNCANTLTINCGCEAAPIINNLFELVENGNDDGVFDLVTNYYDVLSTVIPIEMLNAVLMDGVKLSSRGDDIVISKYLMFNSSEGNIVGVYPIQIIEE